MAVHRRVHGLVVLMLVFALIPLATTTPAVYADNPGFTPGSEFGTWVTESVAVADMDQDGDLDLVLGNRGKHNMVYFNDGNAMFSDPYRRGFGTGTDQTVSVAVGDMDADGDLDIVTGNRGEQSFVYLNNGATSFTQAQPFGGATDKTASVAVGDVDGDADFDIVVGNQGQSNVLYLNDGAANFYAGNVDCAVPASNVRCFGPVNGTARSVAFADLDGDSTLDLVTGNSNTIGSEVGQPNVIYLNDGAANFYTGAVDCAAPAPSVRCFGTGSDRTRSVAVGDVDGDGDFDLATGNRNEPSIVYLNDGLGNFYIGAVNCVLATPSDVRCLGTRNDETRTIVMGDVDADGDLDLAVGNEKQQNFVYLNDGLGNFLFSNALRFGTTTDFTQSVALADMDNDGDLDILAANTFGQPNMVYLNNGVGDFPPGQSFGPNSMQTRGLTLGDLDADGDLDLVSSNNNQDYIYLNDGLGGFYSGNINCAMPAFNVHCFGNGTDQTRMTALGDVDGDGDLDLAVGNSLVSGSNEIGQQAVIYLNDGLANFYSGSINCAAPAPNIRCFGSGADRTRSLAFGDLDGDDDLDLVMGSLGLDMVYLNDGSGNFNAAGSARPFGTGSDDTRSVVIGDMDADGDLDLVSGNSGQRDVVYLNDGAANFYNGPNTCASLSSQIRCFGTGGDDTRALALADVDGDSDLDIASGNALQPNAIYFNDGAGNFTTSRMFGTGGSDTRGLTIDDLDADGDLDIVVANQGQSGAYLNDGSGRFSASRPFGPFTEEVRAVAVGDLDGDGDRDLATGNFGNQSKIYRNLFVGDPRLTNNPPSIRVVRPGPTPDAPLYSTPAMLTDPIIPLSYTLADPEGDVVRVISATYSLDGGDNWRSAIATTDTITTNLATLGSELIFDGVDDYINLNNPATLNFSGTITLEAWIRPQATNGMRNIIAHGYATAPENEVALRINNGTYQVGTWKGGSANYFATAPIPAGDYGQWVHLAGVYDGTAWRLYRNGVELAALPTAFGPDAVAANWAIGARDIGPGRFFKGGLRDVRLWNVARSAAELQAAFNQPVPGDASGLVGSWPLNEAQGKRVYDQTSNQQHGVLINASRVAVPQAYIYRWDTFKSGFFGQSDNVVFRIQAYPSITPQAQRTPELFQRAYAAAQTYPFRARGTQIRITNEGVPTTNAVVYRLPKDRLVGGNPIASGTTPYVTDKDGYLRGRGEINVGDRLLALVPISRTATYTLYYTNGVPTPIGLDTFGVTESGVQTIDVSAAHPLILFDLVVSLEWDASVTPGYLEQLKFDLSRASQYLYDFSDGQVALGSVRVSQNAEDWAYANVVVHSTNRMRPFAAQGGVVITPTLDREHPDIQYSTGQVHMGASWNRYGTPGQNLGDDWSVILSHELSHYLLFQEDSYLGLDENNFLVAVEGCDGSAMGDLYSDPKDTEFIADETYWTQFCQSTLAQRTLGRTEWETIKLWYPQLFTPTGLNDGPGLMPFNLTTVSVYAPLTPTNGLADPTFYLTYPANAVSSSEARAFLIRDDKYVLELGSPIGGQNRVLARGARPTDRLCVFDRPLSAYGCETIALGDDQLVLKQDPRWSPVIQLTPVNSTTFALQVANIAPNLPLKGRMFPEYGAGTAAVTLMQTPTNYSGTIKLPDPTLAGNIQLWVDEPDSETTPRQEVLVAYSIGGNPGNIRTGGGNIRTGGGNIRTGGGNIRTGGAPLVSPDGQMILFTPNPIVFEEGDFYTIQGMAGLPTLPPSKTVVGQGYNLVAAPGTQPIVGSVSFQYLGNEALVAGVDENSLTLHFWNGTGWRALPTIRNPYFNIASAASQGPGVYALMGGTTTPTITTITPAATTNATTRTLTISGGYFLPPASVTLSTDTISYTVSISSVSSTTITAVISAGLQPDEYRVQVRNGDGGLSDGSTILALYAPADAHFYDFFQSGTSQWTLGGEWNIVELANGERAMTDSPAGNYASAEPPNTRRISSITSQPFSLEGLSNPVLQFRHDFLLALLGSSRDEARVELSNDNGATWTTLTTYSGGGVYGIGLWGAANEWQNAVWKQVQLSLRAYRGTVRLRFTLDVDQTVADKGWVIDDVRVVEGTSNSVIFLPMVLR